ncbi:MAG TPA: substrate-binding domain-containing protein [Candidatus Limnocylindrales bacterium]|nr:substrate-binding domain-containing protein [Candidatus Limnocylindrales bacterium]
MPAYVVPAAHDLFRLHTSLRAVIAVFALMLSGAAAAHAQAPAPLRVCADPNNLPFSNERQEGFENKIAEVLAAELGTSVEYTWWAQRRGFIRNTLGEQRCDVLMGVPADLEMVLTTQPYYRSTYVFVTRADRGLDIQSLDDARLRTLHVGVQLIGDDGTNTPPAHALSRRGIVRNVAGYMVYGDYAQPDPPARIIEAVARSDIDVALAWGPMAAFFAARQPVAMRVVPIPAEPAEARLPLSFDIAIGVRKGEVERRDALDALLVRRRSHIEAILDQYRVPLAAAAAREGDPPAAPAGAGKADGGDGDAAGKGT